MHARSALFDLYGDHLLGRDGEATIAALIRLLEPLDVRAPAVRTAVSRLVGQGWLDRVDLDGQPGYRVTARARDRLSEAATRIYRTGGATWDGRWHLLVLSPIADRRTRERVRQQLRYHRMAPISDSTWISPVHSPAVDDLVAAERLATVSATSTDLAPTSRLLDAFDLDGLTAAYESWIDEARSLVDGTPHGDQAAYVTRSRLLHEWRKFLFTDPALPAELLPADWAGHRAAEFFDTHAARLLPATNAFIDACLTYPKETQ